MNHFFAFFELGGGCVFSMACNTSSNLAGARVRRSVLRVAIFFFGLLRFRTCSLSAPSGQRLAMFHQPIKFSGQSIPSNALPVCESLSFGLSNRNFHALAIGSFAIIPTESKFSSVTVQVFAADMMERTSNAPFEQAEKAFASIHMGNAPVCILASVFVNRVINNRVLLEMLFQADINASLVRVYHGVFRGAFIKNRAQILLSDTRNDFCPCRATALNQSNHGGSPQMLSPHVAFSANESLVNFHGSTKQFCQRTFSHSKANSVSHKPRALVSNIKHPVQLVSAHAFLGRAQNKNRHQPFANGNMGILKDCPNRHRKLLAASPAFVNASANGAIALRVGGKLINRLGCGVLAMRAGRAIRPTQRLQKLSGGVVVGILPGECNKVDFVLAQRRCFRYHALRIAQSVGFVKYIIPLPG